MTHSHIKRSAILKRKLLKNLFYLSSCALCFIFGSLLTKFSLDPTKCNIQMCTEKIKQTSVEDSNQWIDQWSKSDGPTKSVFLLILLLSSPSNQEQRGVIRETWLSDELPDTLHYFIIGTAGVAEELNITLQSEQKRFGDLLFLKNIYDSYDVLTKKILASFVYVYHHVRFRFLLKVDDDTYVNLPQLYLDLKTIPYNQRLYWGFFDGSETPKKTGPWKETEWLLCDRYLPYALGGGYILSNDLVIFIATNAKYLKLYKAEDVSVGTWIAPLDVHRIHDVRFDTDFKSRGCNNRYVVTHKQSTIHMREKFNSIKVSGALCRREFQVRKSYSYNWSVPPTLCCVRNDSTIP